VPVIPREAMWSRQRRQAVDRYRRSSLSSQAKGPVSIYADGQDFEELLIQMRNWGTHDCQK
jgi:hypothetical protein